MMKHKNILFGAILLLALSSCEDKIPYFGPPSERINASEITDLRVDNSTPGKIVLHWSHDATATATNLQYVKVEYFDPYTNEKVIKLGSAAGDSVLMEGTFVAGNPYQVTLTPVSSSLHEGAPVQLEAESTPYPKVITAKLTDLPLTADMVKTNAQEPTEGPIADAVDRNNGTYFHSAWSTGISGRHNFQVELKEEHPIVRIAIQPRSDRHLNDTPNGIKLFTSANGTDWQEMVGDYHIPKAQGAKTKVYITRKDGPAETDEYKKQDLLLPAGTRFVKFENVSNHKGAGWFNFSEIYTESVVYEILDREADAKKVIDANLATQAQP